MKRIRLMDVEPPRLLTEQETAHLLGLSASRLSALAETLHARGMPRPHPILKRRDARALHQWLDREFGLQSPADGRRSDVLGRIERLSLVAKVGALTPFEQVALVEWLERERDAS